MLVGKGKKHTKAPPVGHIRFGLVDMPKACAQRWIDRIVLAAITDAQKGMEKAPNNDERWKETQPGFFRLSPTIQCQGFRCIVGLEPQHFLFEVVVRLL